MGYVTVKVEHRNRILNLNLYIVKENLDTIFGREWLYKINLDWQAIKVVRATSKRNLNQLLEEYKNISDDELGEINNYQVKLELKPEVKPIFCRVRTVPFALKGRVENEVDRLEKEGIIEKVEHSEWATSVVPIVKPDGSIRLCADYSSDILFRKTADHGNTDFLSRLPKTSEELEVKDDITIFQMTQIETLPVTLRELRQETGKYEELSPLLRALREGRNLQGREAQYTIKDGCILYGQRVCIPKKYQKNVLDELHTGHLRMVKMKALARSFVYWKDIDKVKMLLEIVSIVPDTKLILQKLKFITGNIPVCPGNAFISILLAQFSNICFY
ncbi:hypothetical protein AVEN_250142-1 [Araneus ventricosus]|uniref:Uncharacterized protein n=1 Tax=Araneus ventricosus TaxID=182803 RepID=A0A4Y2VGA2_ARAVE|nr:hypothetical protein AVEN_250142-1 [Araneus ventricosus]